MVLTTNREVLNDLYLTLHSSNTEEIYDALKRLNPDRLKLKHKLEIVNLIQNSISSEYWFKKKHYNTFGTGGDQLKTINISTISSVIASNFVSVFKIGTKAVTSKWGSVDLINKLNIYKETLSDSDRQKISYKKGSGYRSLNNLGFPYSESLKKARIELYNNGILDIYKLVFPIANFTKSSGQVNGVYSQKYINHFIDILKALDRNSLIVHSEYDVDEIIIGKNKIIRICKGTVTECDLIFPVENKKHYMNFISESNNLEEHISKFIRIVNNDCPEEVIWTIAYNVACILNLEHQNIVLEEISEKVFKYMTSI